MSLRTRLTIAFVLVVVPLVGSTAYFHYSHYYENRNDAIDEQRAIAELLAGSVGVFFQRIIPIQRAAGQALVISHWHEASAQQNYLDSVLESTPELEQLALTDPSGVIIMAAPRSLVGRNLAATSYFRRIVQGAPWIVTGLTDQTLARPPGVMVATAIRDRQGKLLGIVVSGVSERTLGAVAQPVAAEEAALVVVDSEGVVVFQSGKPRVLARGEKLGRYSVVRDALAGKTSVTDDLRFPGGEANVGAVAPISLLGWAAGAFVPRQTVLRPVVTGTLTDVVVTLVSIGAAFALAALLTRRVTRQLHGLTDTAQRLGGGELSVRAEEPDTAEFAALAHTMNQMAASVQERDSAIRTALAREQESAREASALYGIADNLVGSLRLQDRLQALSEGMAEIAGVEACVFYLMEEDQLVVGAVHGFAALHADSFSERRIEPYRLPEAVRNAIQSGQAMVAEAPDTATDVLTIGRTQSVLIVPVRSEEEIMGVAVLYSPSKRSEFSEEVISAETTLAQLARRAVFEARSFEREERIATVLQRTLLGRVPHNIGRVEVATGYFPVGKEAEIGGDLYDVTVLPDGLVGLLIADVSGKGLRAATDTAMVKYMARGFAYHDPDPSVVLRKVNDAISFSAEPSMFTTAFFGVLNVESGELAYASAGHPPPLLRHPDAETGWLEVSPGPPLGVVEGAEYPENRTGLGVNDVLLLYTDGVIEARRRGEWFGDERLEELVRTLSPSPDAVVESVYSAVNEFVEGKLQDDIALVAVKMHERG